MNSHGGGAAPADEALVLDVKRAAAIACFTVAERAASSREAQQGGQHEEEDHTQADALKEPFLLLKGDVFVYLECARHGYRNNNGEISSRYLRQTIHV